MAEPNSSVAVVLTGAGITGVLAGVDPAAAVGALCGALVYFAQADELPIAKRLLFFMVSFVMGYLFSPLLARVRIEWLGVGPMTLPGPAAFVAAALVVTVTLAAIRSRARKED